MGNKIIDMDYILSVYEKIIKRNSEFETEQTMMNITKVYNRGYSREVMEKLIECGLCRKRKCILNAIEII